MSTPTDSTINGVFIKNNLLPEQTIFTQVFSNNRIINGKLVKTEILK